MELVDGQRQEDECANSESPEVSLVSHDETLVRQLGGLLKETGVRLVVSSTPRPANDLAYSSQRYWIEDLDLASHALGSHDLVLHLRQERNSEQGYTSASYRYPRCATRDLVRDLISFIGMTPPGERGLRQVLGRSHAIALVREQIQSVSRFSEVPVLVLGETGTGKEKVAKALHDATFGPDAPFVAINCAAIPEHLLESELFGHEAGAYTGARGTKTGLFEAAAHGTVFLDEIGEMSATMQPKLLRVLESREFRRIGSTRTLALEARVVSATNRNPWISENAELRSDLVYRLAGFSIRLPPLRERADDIEILTDHFIAGFGKRYGVLQTVVSSASMDLLCAHDWPGNVRQLRAVVEHCCIMCREGLITPSDVRRALAAHSNCKDCIDSSSACPTKAPETVGLESGGLRDIERRLISQAVEENRGNVSRAARQLGIPRSTLRSKLKRLDLASSG